MFTTRLISGIVLVILAIFFVGKGGALLFAVTALISLVGLFELYRVLGIEKRSAIPDKLRHACCGSDTEKKALPEHSTHQKRRRLSLLF